MAKAKMIDCRQCGAVMKRTKKTNNNRVMQGVGCITLILGIALLLVFPIGTIVGAIMIVISFGMGYSRTKVWKCEACGYFFERD